MIDRKKFDDTFQYYDKDVILDIISIFEKELPGRLEKIHHNILEQDLAALAFNAHSLKSVAGTFMATEPAGLAMKMEQLATQGIPGELPQLFAALKSASEELLRELLEIRRELLNEDSS
jgi:HPt (histidine-containing phosphotransfer) domain-containing protein